MIPMHGAKSQDRQIFSRPGVTMRLFQPYNATANNTPVPVGVPVATNAQGQFLIQPAPVGRYKLMADGGTALRPGPWPTLEYDIVTVAGQNNTVGLPIFLPVLDTVNRLCVSETTGGTLTLPDVPGFSLTVLPGSATFPGGSRSGCVSVTPVHHDKVPMVPSFGHQPRLVVTIQPVGTKFFPAASMTTPNTDGLRPGQTAELFSFDHDLANFVSVGTGTVSEDGRVVKSDPGVGVLKAGWHGAGNPPPPDGGGENASVTASRSELVLHIDGRATLTAEGSPGDGTYQWSVSNSNIEILGASSSSSVQLRGAQVGTVQISVRYVAPSGEPATAVVNATVVRARLIRLSWGGPSKQTLKKTNVDWTQDLLTDVGQDITTEWDDPDGAGNAREQNPVAYVRGTRAAIQSARIILIPSISTTATIRLQPNHSSLQFSETEVSFVNGIGTLSPTQSGGTVPNSISNYDTSTDWHISFVGQENSPRFGTSRQKLITIWNRSITTSDDLYIQSARGGSAAMLAPTAKRMNLLTQPAYAGGLSVFEPIVTGIGSKVSTTVGFNVLRDYQTDYNNDIWQMLQSPGGANCISLTLLTAVAVMEIGILGTKNLAFPTSRAGGVAVDQDTRPIGTVSQPLIFVDGNRVDNLFEAFLRVRLPSGFEKAWIIAPFVPQVAPTLDPRVEASVVSQNGTAYNNRLFYRVLYLVLAGTRTLPFPAGRQFWAGPNTEPPINTYSPADEVRLPVDPLIN